MQSLSIYTLRSAYNMLANLRTMIISTAYMYDCCSHNMEGPFAPPCCTQYYINLIDTLSCSILLSKHPEIGCCIKRSYPFLPTLKTWRRYRLQMALVLWWFVLSHGSAYCPTTITYKRMHANYVLCTSVDVNIDTAVARVDCIYAQGCRATYTALFSV